ncbi:unannotated protein [freshwater metagenome]|uniref:Unannotated protein n=1 Tax=freshwater metagenome TaxID=449393 RepID=A0A6J7JQ35_9ZZZZ|nr:DUF222 domain-containing protein [Actinomycetota bacterium]
MFDELTAAVSHLREISSRIHVDVIDGKAAKHLVGIADELRRAGDSLRTVAVGQVERTNAWKGEGARSISEWLATETDCAQYEAQSVVILANQLQHLPTTQAALLSGSLSNAQAVEVARGAIVAPNTETQLLNLAKHATVRDLRDASGRVVAAATDEAARHKRIHNSRFLKSWRDPDGAFIIKGRMTVANGAIVMAALKPFQDEIFREARKSGEYAKPEAYAADALMALCAKATTKQTSESGTKPNRANAVMNIRVDINALKRGHTVNGEICEIAGVGPIPVATATEYLGEAFLKLLILDGVEIKTIAHMGRAIPAPLRTAVEERDRVCQVPTCDMTLGLEIDHIKPFSEGGAASFENLVRLCKRHHLQKTHDGYRLERTHVASGALNAWAWRAPPDLKNTG